MLSLLLPVTAAACLVHPGDLDAHLGRRALPWLPPDLARQVARHEREFAQGAAAAARWPAPLHQSGGEHGVEAAILAQCERLVSALRSRTPFADVVAGFGALSHLVLDLHWPLPDSRRPEAAAFARYVVSASPRIPTVFYGQDMALIRGPARRLPAALATRHAQRASLGELALEDLERVGGAAAWRRLDDRSTSFAVASLTLNHAASDFANLASWVWFHGGGLVPEMSQPSNTILVWRGEPRPREAPRPRLGFR